MATAPVSRSPSNVVLEHSARAMSNAGPLVRSAVQPQLLLLSRDADVIEVVRNAAQSIARVAHARDLDDAARNLPDIDPGVVIVASLTTDVAALIANVARRYPQALLVTVGTREESSELMQLAAAGRIFRFLLLPLSFGPVRLTLASAVAQHLERKATSRQLASTPHTPSEQRRSAVSYLALAAVLLASIAGLWTLSRLMVVQAPVPAVPAASPRPSADTGVAPTAKLLASAAEALAEGRFVGPSSDSALALYRSVLALDADSAAAQAGIRTIADEFLQRAEQALLAEDLEAAGSAIAEVRQIDARYPRLDFLDTQLGRERERRNLSRRRDVNQRVRVLVEEARGDMLAGNLIGSAAGGALGALLEARRLDPNNPAVVQNIRELNTAIADVVYKALSTGDTQRAQAFASAARRLGSGAQLLAAVERAVAENTRRTTASLSPPPAPLDVPPPALSVPPPIAAPGTVAAVPLASDEEVLRAADLPLIKQVLPTYPSRAAVAGTEGYVDLEFVIATDGVPRNLKVVDAVPRRVFESAAIACVRQWRFEPITQNGAPVSKRATLRVRFQLK